MASSCSAVSAVDELLAVAGKAVSPTSWYAVVALSIKPRGQLAEVVIDAGVITHGKDIAPLEVHGEVGSLQLRRGVWSANP